MPNGSQPGRSFPAVATPVRRERGTMPFPAAERSENMHRNIPGVVAAGALTIATVAGVWAQTSDAEPDKTRQKAMAGEGSPNGRPSSSPPRGRVALLAGMGISTPRWRLLGNS
jgi:hypothetical protein